MQLIVAIEPRSYRQVIGQAISALRPHVKVTILEPDTLRAGVRRLKPELVFAGLPDTFGASGGTREGRRGWSFAPTSTHRRGSASAESAGSWRKSNSPTSSRWWTRPKSTAGRRGASSCPTTLPPTAIHPTPGKKPSQKPASRVQAFLESNL